MRSGAGVYQLRCFGRNGRSARGFQGAHLAPSGSERGFFSRPPGDSAAGKIAEREAARAHRRLESVTADGARHDLAGAGTRAAGAYPCGSQRRHGRLRDLRHAPENRTTLCLPEYHRWRLGRSPVRRWGVCRSFYVPGRREEYANRVAGTLLSFAL